MNHTIRFFLLLLLTACTAAPPQTSERYLLPEPAPLGRATTSQENAVQLVLRPVQVANYLDVEGIVLQLDDITLNAARTQRWAEPLPRQLQRGLRQRLQNGLPGLTVLDGNTPTSAILQLRIDFTRFHGTHRGTAVAAGLWQLQNAQGVLMDQREFSVELRLPADGYPTLVRTLGATLDELALQLAATLQQQLQ
jgi:uncharacterized protein